MPAKKKAPAKAKTAKKAPAKRKILVTTCHAKTAAGFTRGYNTGLKHGRQGH